MDGGGPGCGGGPECLKITRVEGMICVRLIPFAFDIVFGRRIRRARQIELCCCCCCCCCRKHYYRPSTVTSYPCGRVIKKGRLIYLSRLVSSRLDEEEEEDGDIVRILAATDTSIPVC